MEKFKVGVIGGTGMVGQRFVTLLEGHPWFQLTAIAASARSAGKRYEDVVTPRWAMTTPIPEEAKNLIILDATQDAKALADQVDFVFCAVDMKKDEIRALEETYAKYECPVLSNNSANRWTDDVPMIVPARPRIRRPYRRCVCSFCSRQKAHHGANQGGLDQLQGPRPGVGVALCTQAVHSLF